MSVMRWLTASLGLFGAFATSCYLLAFQSSSISENEILSYLLLGVTALSVFGWPLCLAMAFQTWRRNKRKTRRCS